MRRSKSLILIGFCVLATACAASAALISGTIHSSDASAGKLVVTVSAGGARTFRVPESAAVTLDGKKASLADLQSGHKVSVYTSDAGAVTQVRARAAAAAPATSKPATPRPAVPTNPETTAATSEPAPSGGWTQYGGPARDNRSPDTGLMKDWPEGGPRRLWTATGLGAGYSSVALADGKIFTMGARGNDEFVIAIDFERGEEIWSTRIGSNRRDGAGDGPRGTPTVDGERVYSLGANGDLVCLDIADGRRIWGGNILQEFGGNNIGWGISESVLIDGDKLICTPGGQKATMAALDKQTGRTVWQAKVPGNPPAAYSSAIAVDIGGTRQYVNFTHTAVVGVRASNGDVLWSNGASANGTANCSSPLAYKDYVFSASGYGTGGALVKVTGGRGRAGADLVYHTRQMENHHGGMVIVGDQLYATDNEAMKCLDVMTGDVRWQNRSVGKGAVVYVDGQIILRGEGGGVALIDADPDGYREHGRFDQPERSGQAAWSHPVVAEGRLFLRDQDKLLVYDLRG